MTFWGLAMEGKAGQAVRVPTPRGSRTAQPRVECHFPAMPAPSSGWGASLVWGLVFVKRTVLVWGSDRVVLPHLECQLLSLEACFEPKFILCVITNPKFHSGISASWPWSFREVPWQMAPGIISTRPLELPHWHCYPASVTVLAFWVPERWPGGPETRHENIVSTTVLLVKRP